MEKKNKRIDTKEFASMISLKESLINQSRLNLEVAEIVKTRNYSPKNLLAIITYSASAVTTLLFIAGVLSTTIIFKYESILYYAQDLYIIAFVFISIAIFYLLYQAHKSDNTFIKSLELLKSQIEFLERKYKENYKCEICGAKWGEHCDAGLHS